MRRSVLGLVLALLALGLAPVTFSF